jgi:hypothetical protein
VAIVALRLQSKNLKMCLVKYNLNKVDYFIPYSRE